MIFEDYGYHRGCTGHALVFFYFSANGSMNTDDFKPKTFLILRRISHQNFSLLGFSVLEDIGKQTKKQTDSLTKILLLL